MVPRSDLMPTSTLSAEDIATAYLAAHNAHDPRAVGGLYAPEGRHREMATRAERTGGDAIAEGLASFLAAFPDAAWDYDDPVIDGGRIAVAYALTGTLRGALGPFEPAGQTLDLAGLVLIEVGPDGIRRTRDYWDAATFGRQMQA
jgi:predicted ester cyclase